MPQLQATHESHAASMREGNASQETRHATLEEAKTNEKGRGNQKTDEVAIWQALKADLISVKEDLEKEERVSSSFTQRLSNIIARVPHATHANTNPLGLEARLERIETLLRAPKQPPTQATSWAKVAATITRQAGAPEAILPARHTVRVQMAQTQGKSNEEILREVKKTITGAAAVRILQSGDIDVTVPDEAAKDRAQGLPSTEELKIFKRDYLVEVPSVPLSVESHARRVRTTLTLQLRSAKPRGPYPQVYRSHGSDGYTTSYGANRCKKQAGSLRRHGDPS